MHTHDDYEQGQEPGRRGRRGRGGRSGAAWWGPPPWTGGDEEGAGTPGPGPAWFGGPMMGARGWGHHPGRGWGRARRGDVRSAILALLAERPMHGYEIIAELGERTEGVWRPSPGSIYPTLQLLEDEGLVTSETTTGKRRYSLTDQGRAAAETVAQGPSPWEQVAAGAPAGARALRQAVAKLMPVIWQVGTSGGTREHDEAVKVLEETRKRLYSILAGEQGPGQGPGQ